MTRLITTSCLALLVAQASYGTIAQVAAAERPTLVHTRDPRPDIFPRPIYEAYPEYRRRYNRPRFMGGWMAYLVAPNSQEAMVWKENMHAGTYRSKHSPPRYKRYFAPKPWEVLQTGARPDFAKPESEATQYDYFEQGQTSAPESLDMIQSVPAPLEESEAAETEAEPRR